VDDFVAAFPALSAAAYGVAYRLLGDREDARDVAQEALVRAYVRWRRVSQLALPPAWVAKVSGNLAIDVLRRRSRRALLQEPCGAAEASADDRLDLQQALMALPRRQREVVLLRYVAGFTEPEVATALRCSVGTVKQHAARGRRALQARLTLS
jgi:RNA polymerase sigma factor (sigma-70 family)